MVAATVAADRRHRAGALDGLGDQGRRRARLRAGPRGRDGGAEGPPGHRAPLRRAGLARRGVDGGRRACSTSTSRSTARPAPTSARWPATSAPRWASAATSPGCGVRRWGRWTWPRRPTSRWPSRPASCPSYRSSRRSRRSSTCLTLDADQARDVSYGRALAVELPGRRAGGRAGAGRGVPGAVPPGRPGARGGAAGGRGGGLHSERRRGTDERAAALWQARALSMQARAERREDGGHDGLAIGRRGARGPRAHGGHHRQLRRRAPRPPPRHRARPGAGLRGRRPPRRRGHLRPPPHRGAAPRPRPEHADRHRRAGAAAARGRRRRRARRALQPRDRRLVARALRRGDPRRGPARRRRGGRARTSASATAPPATSRR